MTGSGISELFVLDVDPQRLGHGIGTTRLVVITGELRAQDAHEEWVSTTMHNQQSLPFYKARGFVKQGEQPMYTSDPERACCFCAWSASY